MAAEDNGLRFPGSMFFNTQLARYERLMAPAKNLLFVVTTDLTIT